MNELLSVVQALSYLNIARGTFYKLIREGELKTVKVFSRRLIPRLRRLCCVKVVG